MNERIRPVYKKKNDRRGIGRETVDSISVAPIARVFFEKEVSRKLHCWTKQMKFLVEHCNGLIPILFFDSNNV